MAALDIPSVDSTQPTSAASDWEGQLVRTRLRPPRAPSDEVLRPRLFEELERGAGRKVTLIVSPPGYGKSTLLSQWQRQTDRACAWLTLDPSDNDFLVFIRYLVGAIRSIDPCICQQTAEMLGARSPMPTQQLINSLINEIAESTRPLVLILDDYHAITSAEVESAVSQLVRGMPVNMAMMIAGRREPALPTLRMRAAGELVELGLTDLGFNRDEIVDFLSERQALELHPNELDQIAEWSEGWPVALRLLAGLLRGRTRDTILPLLHSLNDNVTLVSDYLWNEVIESQPEDRRQFLLQTSILERFNADIGAAVTGNPDAGTLLNDLSRENLFIARLDGPGEWHRYHQIFGEILRRRLDPDAARKLHGRAAHWYETRGNVTAAAGHAIQAQDWKLASECLLRICEELYAQERVGSLRAWLRGLPTTPFELEPKLAYWLAWAEIRSGHPKEAAEPLKIAEAARLNPNRAIASSTSLQIGILRAVYDWDVISGQSAVEEMINSLIPSESTEYARMQIMLALLQETEGRLEEAGQTLEAVRSLNTRTGIRGLHVLELNVSAGLQLALGKLKEPAELFRRTIAIGDEWNDLPVQHAHNQIGRIMFEWNRLDEARERVSTAIELADRLDAPIQRPVAHALLAQLAAAAGHWDEAFDEIERAISICATSGFPGALPVFEELQCRIWLATDHLMLAQGWLRQAGPEIIESERYEQLATVLTAMRVLVHLGRFAETINPLERLAVVASRRQWYRELISIHTLRAIAEHELGHVEAAKEAIERALTLGAPEGFVNTYLTEGKRVLPVLALAAAAGAPQRDRAASLLVSAGVSLPESQARTAPIISLLSPRERDVMRLVASGLSNRAIGDTLFISEETVKTHLRRIFEKLEVSSRTQAINRAQQLGLL